MTTCVYDSIYQAFEYISRRERARARRRSGKARQKERGRGGWWAGFCMWTRKGELQPRLGVKRFAPSLVHGGGATQVKLQGSSRMAAMTVSALLLHPATAVKNTVSGSVTWSEPSKTLVAECALLAITACAAHCVYCKGICSESVLITSSSAWLFVSPFTSIADSLNKYIRIIRTIHITLHRIRFRQIHQLIISRPAASLHSYQSLA